MKPTNENKTKEQNIVLQKWMEANFIGTYVGFTGVGKTKIGTIGACEFIRRDPNETSLVVVPTVNLRDNEWEKSFIDWGYLRERPKVTVECVQTAYKFKGRHFDTIVIDEWHQTLTPSYIDLLKNNTYKRLLCLSATLEDEKVELTKLYAPVIWTTSRDRAIQLKLVSESLIFNIAVPLNEVEQATYNSLNSSFMFYEQALGGRFDAYDSSVRFMRLQKANSTCSNMRVFIPENRIIYDHEINEITIPSVGCRLLNSTETAFLKQRIHQAANYWNYMRQRRTLCCNASNKIPLVHEIINRFPDRRAIIFSTETAFADRIADEIGSTRCGVYHSKLLPKEKKLSIGNFMSGIVPHLSSVKALNAGMDVPECSLGIATSGDSKKLGHIQRNGRTSRYIDGKVSYFINMYAKDTQEWSWINKGTKLMDPKWIESIEELPVC